ncbi:truncated transcription factor CAULIFLOWER A-like isoform X2 [Cynara cardunculus var. scolymus]|uniref:truncated transcription factor CAULIFLOWER A-like isoform X2 n=1 Tax=Cynara cardunculus var. scolymus TaxID=59895 RepID=UPI000D62BA7A|nr:truncated transcription factor CAULIFLOWER A-like isoform X2 [Cynara cardunculus var. scolymus]
MGRGKVELKRIEDKSSRQVSFSKRRNGLMKKTHELAVLCDVDVALFIFSGRGRLYEFSTGESMIKLLTRYQSYKKTEELTRISVHKKLDSENVCSADELTQILKWHLEENNIQLLDTTGLNQLEQQLDSLLQQVRIRKTQQMMEVVKALQEEEMQLKKERNFMMEEIMAARSDGIDDDSGDPSQPQRPVMDAQIIW